MASGDTDRRAVRVTIFQQPYTLRAAGDASETEHLAAGVDELMTRIAERAASADPMRVAVLAALHLADKVRTMELHLDQLEDRARTTKLQIAEAEQRAQAAEQKAAALKALLEQAGAPGRDSQAVELHNRLEALEERLSALLEDNSRS